MKQYIVDAFTDTPFKGNPAAVCVVEQFPSEKTMMNIAMENCFSETAFIAKIDGKYHLRWFTPEKEIGLCGHATLASSSVILNYYEKDAESVSFQTQAGVLTIRRKGDLFEMTFPKLEMNKIEPTSEIISALNGITPIEVYSGLDMMCVLEREDEVMDFIPDQNKIALLKGRLLHITAKGKDYDCSSRSFGPKYGIPEDPVCGSAHCMIAPYWAETLSKDKIIAFQGSKRTGVLYCTINKDNVLISGKTALFAISEINI